MWSFCLGLIFCVVSFLPAYFDHGERRKAFMLAKGKEKWLSGVKLVVLNWGLPILAISITIAQGLESVATDGEVNRLRTQGTHQSNLWRQAESALNEVRGETTNAIIEARAAANKIATLEPSKQRIVSVAATACIRAHVLNITNVMAQSEDSSRLLVGRSGQLKSNNGWTLLFFDPVKERVWVCKEATKPEDIGKSEYIVEFGPVFRNDGRILSGLIGQDDSVKVVDEFDVLSLRLPCIAPDTEILGGTVTLLINASTIKEYQIPRQKPFMSEITSKIGSNSVSTFEWEEESRPR